MEKDSSGISIKQQKDELVSRRLLASKRHKSPHQQPVLSTPVCTAQKKIPFQVHPSPPKLKRKIYSSGNEKEEHSSLMSSSFFFSSEGPLNLPCFDEILGSSSTFLPLNLRPRKCSLTESKDLSGLLSHELDSDDGEATLDDQQPSHHGARDSSASNAASIRLVSAFERPRGRRRG